MSKKCAKIIVVVRAAKTEQEVSFEKDKLVVMRQVTVQSLQRKSVNALNFMELLHQVGVASMLNRQFYAHLMFEFLNTIKDQISANYSSPYPKIENFKEAFDSIIDFASLSAQDASNLFRAANWIKFIVTDPFSIFADSPKVKTSIVLCVSMLANECDTQDDTKGISSRKLKGLIYNHDVELHTGASPPSSSVKQIPAERKRKHASVDVEIEVDDLDDNHASKHLMDPQYCISPISISTDFNEIDWSPRPNCDDVAGGLTPVLGFASMETKLSFEDEVENDVSFIAMCTHILSTNNKQDGTNLGGDIEPVAYWESLFSNCVVSDGEQQELLVY